MPASWRQHPAYAWMMHGRNIVRCLVTGHAAWLCFILALPEPTFPGSRSWDLMARLAPEPAWSAIFGLDVVVIVIIAWVGSKFAHVVGAALQAALMSFVALKTFQANPFGGASGLFLEQGLASLWLMYRRYVEV